MRNTDGTRVWVPRGAVRRPVVGKHSYEVRRCEGTTVRRCAVRRCEEQTRAVRIHEVRTSEEQMRATARTHEGQMHGRARTHEGQTHGRARTHEGRTHERVRTHAAR